LHIEDCTAGKAKMLRSLLSLIAFQIVEARFVDLHNAQSPGRSFGDSSYKFFEALHPLLVVFVFVHGGQKARHS
jgi:hypothetical protein